LNFEYIHQHVGAIC